MRDALAKSRRAYRAEAGNLASFVAAFAGAGIQIRLGPRLRLPLDVDGAFNVAHVGDGSSHVPEQRNARLGLHGNELRDRLSAPCGHDRPSARLRAPPRASGPWPL